jgi:general secretion pathway protein A
MSYFQVLGFDKEPFSTSPDPNFFYLSKEHEAALTSTLIELRLRRGLSVILGDVGTGKTTLSRRLIPELTVREDFVFHMILDPSFSTEEELMLTLNKNFDITPTGEDQPTGLLDLKDSLERFLFQKGVTEGKTVVLIIDEAQKLNERSLEILRVLLNYETNEYKLLQLVLLGQLELHSTIMQIPNFIDRISFKYTLNPLGLKETGELIEFRVRQAGYDVPMHLFLDEAIQDIYYYTRGYPRKITLFCHRALKQLVMKGRPVVDRALVRELIDEEVRSGWAQSGSVAVH